MFLKDRPGRVFLFVCLYNFQPRSTAHGISAPQSGIKPPPSALKVWSLNHWATGKVLFWWWDAEWLVEAKVETRRPAWKEASVGNGSGALGQRWRGWCSDMTPWRPGYTGEVGLRMSADGLGVRRDGGGSEGRLYGGFCWSPRSTQPLWDPHSCEYRSLPCADNRS